VVRYEDLSIGLIFSVEDERWEVGSWQSLVHVCRRWRGLVFASPRRLNLQLFSNHGISERKTLDVWPALPLLIEGDVYEFSVGNIIAELEHNDRILRIFLDCYPTSQFEKLWTAMQVPFPELTSLYLSCAKCTDFSHVPALPDSFLGGSAPRLRYFRLDAVQFLGLPKLLSSVTHLVKLYLDNIPHSGYFSPETMATCLSTLTSLTSLKLYFVSPQSSPDQEGRRSPSLTRSVLPALAHFSFKGVNEYSEELVARIDTPQLYRLSAIFFNDIDLDTPELIRFVSRSPRLEAPNKAHVFFGSQTASVRLRSFKPQPQASTLEYFDVRISCREPDWQLSSLAQICTTSLPLLSTTENLFISERNNSQLDWKAGIENIEWLELLLPFSAVKNLHLSEQFAPRIAPTLHGGGTTEVLPALQNLFLEGFQPSEPVHEGIERFISARQLANSPVAISVWERDPTQENLY
jgi:hypothetical protein